MIKIKTIKQIKFNTKLKERERKKSEKCDKMRDLINKIFERRYSAVNASDNPYGATVEENIQHLQQIGFNHRHRKSLQASRPLKHGLSIVDSFFNERKSGKRNPKCKIFAIFLFYSFPFLHLLLKEFQIL